GFSQPGSLRLDRFWGDSLKIAASADIHSPKLLDLFRESLHRMEEPDLFVLAGDLVLKNDFKEIPKVVSSIREVYEGRIVACLGNEEYGQDKSKYLKYREITWLDDSSVTMEFKGEKLTIIGSRGSLDRPTYWQRTHVKGIWRLYAERVKVIDSLLAGAKTGNVVVVTHYAPTQGTMVGERRSSWPEMGSKKFEDVIRLRQPSLWVHGHIHRGTVSSTYVGKTLVVNTSLPARREVVLLELPKIRRSTPSTLTDYM
ncbi:MAG: metallophosphoesterase, partial [Thermoplasmata archaeon]